MMNNFWILPSSQFKVDNQIPKSYFRNVALKCNVLYDFSNIKTESQIALEAR
jgi:hypothetical protein